MRNAMIINEKDNVAVVVEHVAEGETVTWLTAGGERSVVAQEAIRIYHKIAICDIAKGEKIVKYGEHIGEAACAIRAGEHVHTHNVLSVREDLDSKAADTEV